MQGTGIDLLTNWYSYKMLCVNIENWHEQTLYTKYLDQILWLLIIQREGRSQFDYSSEVITVLIMPMNNNFKGF